ncbi:MAG: sel1 repeat family protein, partial [Clostridia bacterium]|nr:sel1 repeat family protein [Clostridia bacterium]
RITKQVEAGTVFCDYCGERLIEENDDPWAEIDQKSDDPWANFADYKEPETIVIEKPVEIVVEKVVEKPVEVEKTIILENKNELQDAINAFYRKDYAFATSTFERLANQGDAQAQYWVAFCYRSAKGYKRSHAKARDWYTKSAEQGNPDAMVGLAELYWNGWAVPQSDEKREYWLKQAASTGGAKYQHELANFYSHYSKPRQYDKALELFTKSAEQNYGPAMYELAWAYYNEYSLNIPNDYNKARYWNEKGVALNDADSLCLRGDWHAHGNCGFEKSRVKAIEYYKKAKEQGHPYADLRLKKI